MIVREPFKFLYSFSAALAASALLVYAAGVSGQVIAPQKPNSAKTVKIQPGEPLKEGGYAKKFKSPVVKPKVKIGQ